MGTAFVNDWAVAKDEYYKLTGEKKPRESFAKFFSTSHTGLTSSIEALTVKWELRAEKDQTVMKYVTLLDDYREAMDKYVVTLDKLIKEESKKTKTLKVPNHEPEAKETDMFKGLEMLKGKLEKYRSSFELKLKKLSVESAIDSEQERQKETRILEMQRGYRHFESAAKAILATPTLEVYNREFGTNKAAAKLVGALEHELRVSQNSQDKERAAEWINKLSPWVTGDRRKLDSKHDVVPRLKEAVKAFNDWSNVYRIK